MMDLALANNCVRWASGTCPRNSTLLRAFDCKRSRSGPSPDISNRHPSQLKASTIISRRL